MARASRADRETRRDGRSDDKGHDRRPAPTRLGGAAADRQPGTAVRASVRGSAARRAHADARARRRWPWRLGYLVVGRDLIPDDLPVIGGLDDLIVVVLAVDLFLDGVPDDVLDEKLEELGVDRRAFEEDVRRIRRFTPAPLRRIDSPPAGRRVVRRAIPCATASSGRGSGAGSTTRRVRSREGDPDEGRREARQDGRDEDGRGRIRPELPHPAEARRVCVRRRLPRVPARHREPRGEAEARARGCRDRGHSHRLAPRSRWA